MPTIETLTNAACRLAEGPIFVEAENAVYFVDIMAGELHRYDLGSGAHEVVWSGPMIGGFTVQEDGALLLFMDKGAIMSWKKGVETNFYHCLPDELDTRFNDVAADPMGRVFCGTMGTKKRDGRLYRLDLDMSIHPVLEGVGCSNGIGFSPDRKTMYHTDSSHRTIYSFDYQEATGEISNRQDFFVLPDPIGVPDGMTVDVNGEIWSGIWDGGCLLHISAEGKELERIEVEARKVSCATFGGPNYATLFLTTAGGDKKPEEGPVAGELLRLDVGVHGVPEFKSRIKSPY